MSQMPHLPFEHDKPVECGGLLVDCNECGQPIPITIEAARIRDEDGDDCVWIEQNMADYELHLLTHQAETIANGGMAPDEN